MVVFAIIVFGVTLVAIAALFVLKRWEITRGRVLAPALRIRADHEALVLKNQLFHLRRNLARVAPIAVLYLRYLIHEGALGFASFARLSERQAHHLADAVSHKRTFVPRETKSEFLKKVSEHKNGGGQA